MCGCMGVGVGVGVGEPIIMFVPRISTTRALVCILQCLMCYYCA